MIIRTTLSAITFNNNSSILFGNDSNEIIFSEIKHCSQYFLIETKLKLFKC